MVQQQLDATLGNLGLISVGQRPPGLDLTADEKW